MTRRGFSLLEMLVVLVLLGLFAAVSATALGRRGDALGRAGEAVVTRLLDARVVAMRTGEGAVCVVVTGERGVRMWVEAKGERVREREIGLAGASIVDETVSFGWGAGVSETGEVRAAYGASGRTDARRWSLVRGDTMVVIEFDPVTGVPALHRNAGGR